MTHTPVGNRLALAITAEGNEDDLHTIAGYNGQPIDGCLSLGQSPTFAAFDYEDLVFGQPDADLQRKAARASAHLSDFEVACHGKLTQVLGHYSDVQSLKSEDTVTWSVARTQNVSLWLSPLLGAAFGHSALPSTWVSSLWVETPHPAGRGHGPEHDVITEGQSGSDQYRYVAEMKWDSDIDPAQGALGNQSQLVFRWQCAQAFAGNTVPSNRCGVIVVVPSPRLYLRRNRRTFLTYFRPNGVTYDPLPSATILGARALTWEEIAKQLDTSKSGLADYLRWRLDMLDSPPVRTSTPTIP